MKVHHFAIATALATFLLLVVGGTVNPTGSSLACPDWPTCYGSFVPEMTGGVEFEHTHRVVATIVGLMTVILGVWLWRRRDLAPGLRRLGGLAILMVVLQGVLGGITVLLKLPDAISVSHLALSMLFFLTTLFIAWRLTEAHRAETGRAPQEPLQVVGPRKLVWLTLASVYVQILLGGLVRHTESGRACGESIPFCAGEVWPSWFPGQVHMIHRYVGVAVALLLIATGIVGWLWARRAGRRWSARLALSLPLLAVLQVGLGVLTVTSYIAVVPVTAHMGVGALLLAGSLLLLLSLGPAAAPVAARMRERLSEATA